MKTKIVLPHEVHEGTCYVNGLYDILAWKGAEYNYFLLPVIGGMASFAYLKFKRANPPCMVYWGTSPKYLLQELGEVIGFTHLLSEGKSYKNEFPRMKDFLDRNQPVLVGSLDMFHLRYYPELYKKEHVPIHYVLLVGYDDEKAAVYVHDCSHPGVQEVPYDEFEQSLMVNVPGVSRKNTYRVFDMPKQFIGEKELAENGFARKSKRMLKPPVSLLGIPAMRKLAKEITTWTDRECYKHMAAYAGLTPPLVSDDLSHNDGMRFEQARVMKQLGHKFEEKRWTDASNLFARSGELIIELCREALKYNGHACSKLLAEIASIEEEAYGRIGA